MPIGPLVEASQQEPSLLKQEEPGARWRSMVSGAIAALVLLLAGALALVLGMKRQRERDTARLYARALAHCQRADLASFRGDSSTARSEYEQATDSFEELLRRDAARVQARRELALCSMREGAAALKSESLQAARDAYERSVRLNQELLAASPDDTQAQSDLSIGLLKLGEVLEHLEGLRAPAGCVVKDRAHRGALTLAAYQRSVQAAEKLAAEAPHSPQAQRDLSLRLRKLGWAAARVEQLEKARDAYQRSVQIAEKLSLSDRGDAQARRELSQALSALGSVAARSGRLSEARAAHERSLQLLEELAVPGSAASQHELVDRLLGLVSLGVARGVRPAEIGAAYQRSVRLLMKLGSVEGGSAQERFRLASDLIVLSEASGPLGFGAEAAQIDRRTLEIFAELLADDALDIRTWSRETPSPESVVALDSLGPPSLRPEGKLSPASARKLRIHSDLSELLLRAATQAGRDGRPHEAEAFLALALRSNEKVRALDPQDAAARRRLLDHHILLAGLRQQLRRSADVQLRQARLLLAELRPTLPEPELKILQDQLRSVTRR
jgi:tetratricopeptide (TPR) repeat protein